MFKQEYFFAFARSIVGRSIPDRIYLPLVYRKRVGRRLDLRNPRSFTEKIQWLKMNWRNNLLTQCADKYEVRKFVEDRVGSDILKALYGVYDKPEEIDISKLPDAFVLKVNRGCNQNIFCKNKSDMDWTETFRLLKRYLKEELYPLFREWAYKNIIPRIICEEYLSPHDGPLNEYGFYCYHGVPRQVEINEYLPKSHCVNMFDVDLNLLENKYGSAPLQKQVTRIPQYEKMLDYATNLSRGFPFVRVDLLYFNERIYFGEMTFYPLAGMCRLDPESFDDFLGSHLEIPA
jgi:hypothetical protein